jgi:hypothetical protein
MKASIPIYCGEEAIAHLIRYCQSQSFPCLVAVACNERLGRREPAYEHEKD